MMGQEFSTVCGGNFSVENFCKNNYLFRAFSRHCTDAIWNSWWLK